jgi:hypothetical protein
MDSLSFDAFCQIVSNRHLLSPTDVKSIMLCCKRFCDWTAAHLTNSATLSKGYPLRPNLLRTFTCYCGRIGWEVRYQCACFIGCNCCSRKLPERLTTRLEETNHCGFPCEKYCDVCNEWITEENVHRFKFSDGFLSCKRHGWLVTSHRCEYEWINAEGKKVHSLFASILYGADSGAIDEDFIASYDPEHIFLKHPWPHHVGSD